MARILATIPKGQLVNIAALAPFQFHYAHFGGADRIMQLLSRVQAPVEVFAPTGGHDELVRVNNLTIHYKSIPEWVKTAEDYDIAISKVAHEMFANDLAEQNPDVVILEHPWQIDALSGQKFVYDAHNDETKMKIQLSTQEIAIQANALENKALAADHVTFCSMGDEIETDSPKTFIPNGTNLPNISRLNGAKLKTLLFVGSAHPPNVAAALMLANLGPALADYEIIIAGQCSTFINTTASNVRLLGHVSDAVLDYLFANTHAFINLITAGSGTSLKVARALSYGLPVISSPLGARGYEGSCIIARDAQELLSALDTLQNASNYKLQSETARQGAEAFSWDAIGKRFSDVVLGLL
jgi:glycosyltransferase involved in cell wall biosynthesis